MFKETRGVVPATHARLCMLSCVLSARMTSASSIRRMAFQKCACRKISSILDSHRSSVTSMPRFTRYSGLWFSSERHSASIVLPTPGGPWSKNVNPFPLPRKLSRLSWVSLRRLTSAWALARARIRSIESAIGFESGLTKRLHASGTHAGNLSLLMAT